jgi:hypothetical protein
MSEAYRPVAEQQLLAVSDLTARVAALERSAAGMPGTVAFATIALTLTNAYQDIVGTTIAITQPGRYLLIGIFDVDWQTASAGVAAFGQIVPVGASTSSNSIAMSDGNAVNRKTIGTVGYATWPTTGTVNLQAEKSAALGVCVVQGSSVTTALMAIRTGPA